MLLAMFGGLLLVWLVLLAVLFMVRPRNVPLREAIRLIPDLLRLVRSLLTDRSAPLAVRIALVVAIAWLVSPIDLVPEFLPVIGPLDDIVVVVLLFRYAARSVPAEAFYEAWPAEERLVRRLLGRPPGQGEDPGLRAG